MGEGNVSSELEEKVKELEEKRKERKELEERISKAQSTEEVQALLTESGADMSPEQAELIHTLAKQILDPASRELSMDELQAVAGGATERDWDKDGCAATVESGSFCWFTDGGCDMLNVSYINRPIGNCPKCGKLGLIRDDKVFVEKISSTVDLYKDILHCHYCGYAWENYREWAWF